MADLKITDLGAALSVGDSNVTVLDDGTSTMKVTMNQLKEYSIGTTDISGIGNGTATGAISSVNTSKNNVRDSIAPTETSTASRAYEVDEKMYISDVLYKATRNIALGDPLVSGTNITPANDVSTEIIELKSDASEAIDSVKNIIAPVEDGGTAVLSYSAGDQFIHLGALCKAKTTINAGDTFIINTNYEDAGQVVDQFDSVKQALSDVNANQFANGCVNLLENRLSSQSNKGVIVTVDSEGIITLSGALEQAESYVTFTINAVQKFPKGRYKLSGTPPTSDGTYWLRVTSGFDSSVNDAGQGADLTQSSDNPYAIYLMLYITSHNSLNGIKFKPMITVEGLPNSDYNHYVPYAKSNRELTDDVTSIKSALIPRLFKTVGTAYVSSANQSFSFTLENSAVYLLLTTYYALDDGDGLYSISVNNDGSVNKTAIKASSNISITKDNYSITVTSTRSYCNIILLKYDSLG